MFIRASLVVSLGAMLCVSAYAKAPNADNTAQNKGATREDSVTAEKQNNSKSDVDSLAEIRKAVVAKDGLSMNAKNVKILYSKGDVTLKGVVDSEAEKETVEQTVKACSCVKSIKNMLTVKK